MPKILCATRGGEESYKAQDAAIALSKDRGAELVFLFVVDADFLNKAERAVRRDVVLREMDHMARFLLTMAIERAKQQGVSATYIIREGEFRNELMAVARDENIFGLVMGRPVGAESHFSMDALHSFAADFEAQTDTQVIFTDIEVNEA